VEDVVRVVERDEIRRRLVLDDDPVDKKTKYTIPP